MLQVGRRRLPKCCQAYLAGWGKESPYSLYPLGVAHHTRHNHLAAPLAALVAALAAPSAASVAASAASVAP